MVRVAINGFGRIGRTAFKQAIEKPDEMEVVAINDLTTKENLAYLLRYDSVHGPYQKDVEASEEGGKEYIKVEGKKYPLFNEKDPAALPWEDLDVDVVIESTGIFTTKEAANAHLEAGAKRVVISAPAKDDTEHLLVGTNDDKFENADLDKVTSDASCTTNAVMPVLSILLENPGVEKTMMTTVHGYTSTQSIVDGPSKKDPLRGRAAAQNIIPSKTGAAVASAKTNPELEDKFDAMAMRVPVICGSIVDLTFIAKKEVTAEEVNDILRDAAQQERWKNIFTVSEEPLVSTDILGNHHASIADLSFTRVVGGDMVKVLAWYDNEWGYTHTLIEHVLRVGNLEK